MYLKIYKLGRIKIKSCHVKNLKVEVKKFYATKSL